MQASNFLQKHGVTRTASERTAEIKDIDFNSDNRISFLEYVILQYKAMILKQFYERNEDDPVEDLSNGAVGVVGVGDKLLDELFTLVGKALDPEIEAALEEMTRKKKAQAAKLKELEERAAAGKMQHDYVKLMIIIMVYVGGVKGKAAANEIVQLKQQDPTEFNRLEITLNAAKRKALKSSGDVALSKKKKMEADSEKKKLQASRERLAAKAALFNSQEKVNSASPTQPRKSPNNNLSSGHSGSVSAIANKFGNVGGRIATTESNEDLAA